MNAPETTRDGDGGAGDLAELADAFVQRVTEWDDRTSPEDWPEALLITGDELKRELLNFASEAGSLAAAPAVGGRARGDGQGAPASPSGSHPSGGTPDGFPPQGDFDPSRTAASFTRDEIRVLYDECRGWHDSVNSREVGDGAFTIRSNTGVGSDGIGDNLRGWMRDVGTVLLGILSREGDAAGRNDDLVRRLRMWSTLRESAAPAPGPLMVEASNALVAAGRAVQRASEGFDPQRREAVACALADLTYEAACTMDGMAGDTFSPVEARGILKAKGRLQDLAFKRWGVQMALTLMFPSAPAPADEHRNGEDAHGAAEARSAASAVGRQPEAPSSGSFFNRWERVIKAMPSGARREGLFPVPPIAECDAELKRLRAEIDAYFADQASPAPSITAPGADLAELSAAVANVFAADGDLHVIESREEGWAAPLHSLWTMKDGKPDALVARTCLAPGSKEHATLLALGWNAARALAATSVQPALAGGREALREKARAIAEAAANRWDAFSDMAGIVWLADQLLALAQAPAQTDTALERVRHKKRGTEYEVLGEAEARVSTGTVRTTMLGKPLGGVYRRIADGSGLTVYRCTKTGKLWCRPTDEFRDGRFETIAPAQTDTAALRGGEEDWLPIETAAARDVLAERRRQVEAEGWTPEHDDAHGGGEMAWAAAAYALHAAGMRRSPEPPAPHEWPWSPEWWKPTDRRRDLVKAAALLLADIERLDRAAPPSVPEAGRAQP